MEAKRIKKKIVDNCSLHDSMYNVIVHQSDNLNLEKQILLSFNSVLIAITKIFSANMKVSNAVQYLICISEIISFLHCL